MAENKKKKKSNNRRRRATQIVDGQIDRAIRDLNTDRAFTMQGIRNQAQVVRNDYRRGVKDINHVYGETSDFIENKQNEINQNNVNLANMQASATQALRNNLGTNFQNSYSGLAGEMERMGVQGNFNPTAMFAEQQANVNQADQGAATAKSSLDLMAMGQKNLGNIISGQNKASFQSSQGQNLNNRNDALAELRTARGDEMRNFWRARRGIRNSRGDLILQVLEALRR